MRIRTALGILALVASTGAVSPAAHAATADDRAARLAGAFVTEWLRRHPEEATRLGDHTADTRLPVFTRAALADDAIWAARWRDSLAAIPLEPLSPASRDAVRLALVRAGDEARTLAVDRRPQRDPGEVLARIDRAIRTPIRGFYASSCSRGALLRRRLHALPELLRDAQLILERPSRAATELAIADAERLLHLCREVLPVAFASCREARIQADLAEADSLATRALFDYAEGLRRSVLPRAEDELPFGRESLERRLGDVAGQPVDLAPLLERLRGEWERGAAAPVHGSRLGRGEDGAGTAWLEMGRIGVDSARVVLDALRVELARGRVFRIDSEEKLEVSAFSPPPGDGTLVAIGPWDSRGTRVRLDFGPPLRAGSGALGADPLGSRAETELEIAREGFPGRGLMQVRLAGTAVPRPRQALGLEEIVDGWGRYAEWRVSEGAAERASVHRLREQERLARAITEIAMRVEGLSVDSAAAWLERTAGLTAGDARSAALEAAVRPRWAASTVAFWNFRALREQAMTRLGGGFDEAAFHDALTRAGAVPTLWASEQALHTPPRRRRS